jgi:hypothetical protein
MTLPFLALAIVLQFKVTFWTLLGFFVGGFFLGILIPRSLFKFMIHAKCPKCGGTFKYRGGQRIHYQCMDCQHVEQTSLSDDPND